MIDDGDDGMGDDCIDDDVAVAVNAACVDAVAAARDAAWPMITITRLLFSLLPLLPVLLLLLVVVLIHTGDDDDSN